MPVYKIPITWEVYGVMEIEADSIEEAILKADDHPYPLEAEDVDGSQEVNFEMIEHFNPGIKVSGEPEGIVEEYYKQKEFGVSSAKKIKKS